jgi:hypothetical protein
MNIVFPPFFFFYSATAQHGHRPHLTGEVSRSNTHTHTHLLGQLVSEAATYTTLKTQKRQMSMPSWGFQLVVPAIKWLQAYS